MATITITTLKAAKNAEALLDQLDDAGIVLEVEDAVRLTKSLKTDFMPRRLKVIQMLRSEGLFKADGTVDAAAVADQDKVNQWYTGLIANLDPPAKPEEKPAEEPPKRKPEEDDDATDIVSRYGRQVHSLLGGGVLAKLLGDFASNYVYDKVLDREKPTVQVTGEAAGNIVRGGKSATAAAAGAIRQVGKVALVAVAVLVGIDLILLAISLFALPFAPFGLIITLPIWLLLVVQFVYARRVYSRLRGLRLTDDEWKRTVGNEYYVGLRTLEYTFAQVATDNKAFNRMVEWLEDELDTLNPWANARERQVNNVLAELNARAIQFYKGLDEANAVISDPKFAGFPHALYEMELEGDPDTGKPGRTDEESRKSLWSRIQDAHDSDW